MSVAELARAAGVSVRTIRYYIAEGLLPPPRGAGPRSSYDEGHLDRLRLIARLKADYLPLREIRRRLAGLDDRAVARLLAAVGDRDRAEIPRGGASAPAPPGDPHIGPSWMFADTPGAGGFEHSPPPATGHGWEEPMRASLNAAWNASTPGHDPFAPPAPLTLGAAVSLAPPFPVEPVADEAPALVEADAWRRVRVSDDIEILIRDATYERRRDLIDWLIAWARKVFR